MIISSARRTAALAIRVRPLSAAALSRWGYRGILLLSIALPFEVTQRPLPQTPLVTLTNLSALWYLAAILAALTLWHTWTPARWRAQRRPLLLLGALITVAFLSSVHSAHRTEGLKWTVDLILGGLLWQAIPMWLGDDTERRLRGVARALVAGAALSAFAGLLEVVAPSLDGNILSLFKAKPTVIGPYLRLSGSFQYANTAGGYLAAVLPFALAWILARATRRSGRPMTLHAWVGSPAPEGNPADPPSLETERYAAEPGGSAQETPTFGAWIGSEPTQRSLLHTRPLRAHRVEKGVAIAAFALTTAALALTFSRGAWLGAVAGLAVFAAATRRRWPRVRLTGARLLFLTGAALALSGGVAVLLDRSGPATLRLTTQSDLEWYQADLRGALPRQVHPDTLLSVPVTVRNPSPLTWVTHGPSPFHLSYHWLLADNRIVVLDGVRTPLPHDLPPGKQVTVQARVLTPLAVGRYRFAWDITEEHVAWFKLHTGSMTSTATVVAGRSGRAALTQSLLATPLQAPTAAAQPERSVLWAAALRIMRSHPLLGIGPNGYRLTYGLYERPPQTQWDTRIYANSLPLEIGADLGIAGLLVFIAFLLAAIGPAFVRVLRRGRADVWTAAIIAAPAVLLAHGTVDYLLGSRAVLLLFWITLGLIAALPATDASPVRIQTAPKIEVAPKK